MTDDADVLGDEAEFYAENSGLVEMLAAQVSMFDAVLSDLDDTLRDLRPADVGERVAILLEAKVTLGTAALALVRERLDTLIGDTLGRYETIVAGVGVVRRHKRDTRKSWHKDDLLRAVLDTKLVNTETGEILDETPLDKVLTVWNLPAPRITALRDRGLDPEDFCSIEERPGWSIEIK